MKNLSVFVFSILVTSMALSNSLEFNEGRKIYDCTIELFSDQSGQQGVKKVQRVVIDPPTNGLYTEPVVVSLAPDLDRLKARKHTFTYYYPSLLHQKFRLKLSVTYLDARQGREHVYTEAKNADTIRLVASKPNSNWDPSILECTPASAGFSGVRTINKTK